MEYNGDLYGKVGGMVFKTGKTSKDWDDMEARLKKLEAENLALKQANGVNSDSKALHIDSVMPRSLTAENGAKGLLIGEFYETIICHDEDGEPYEVKMPVEWDTIKQIYAKIVDYYGA